jgi:hypothetical protein
VGRDGKTTGLSSFPDLQGAAAKQRVRRLLSQQILKQSFLKKMKH